MPPTRETLTAGLETLAEILAAPAASGPPIV
jgi:hypothetical protein